MDDDMRMEVTRGERDVAIVCGGVMDVRNSKPFEEALASACESAEQVAVDMRDVVFIDTAILQYLATGSVKMRDRGNALRVIVSEGTHPERVLRITGMDRLAEVELDREQSG